MVEARRAVVAGPAVEVGGGEADAGEAAVEAAVAGEARASRKARPEVTSEIYCL